MKCMEHTFTALSLLCIECESPKEALSNPHCCPQSNHFPPSPNLVVLEKPMHKIHQRQAMASPTGGPSESDETAGMAVTVLEARSAQPEQGQVTLSGRQSPIRGPLILGSTIFGPIQLPGFTPSVSALCNKGQTAKGGWRRQ